MNNINYTELKDSIIAGCNEYLYLRANKGFLHGLFHGKQGVNRANNTQILAAKLSTNNDENKYLLLALLLGILNSRSNGLAMCIVSKLIKGDIKAYGIYPNDFNFEPIEINNNLRSHVFSKDLLYLAVKNNTPIHISDSPTGPVMGIDKRKCAAYILNENAPKTSFFKNVIPKVDKLLTVTTNDISESFNKMIETSIK